MIYLDTSVVVPLIVPETTSSRARSWFERLDSAQTKALAVSARVLTEFTSAMGIKVRNREITRSQGEAARALLEDALLPNVSIIEVTPTDFRLAETMLREFSLGLRAGDALHLATASRCAAQQFVSLDRKLCNVAAALGLSVTRI
jgi:uncharacterized protein